MAIEKRRYGCKTDFAKVRTLTEENDRLKRIVAELHPDNQAYKVLDQLRAVR
jgi:hypothetical protein